jgi:pyruvate dehydrogenase E2 component (dihydrolipoamide acetyltransferase)
VPIEVTMPKLSPTMETGVIVQWLVKVGDVIKEGDPLADIETDKATMQMKSYDDGTIAHIDHAAGDEVAFGARVLVLAKKGKDPKAVGASLGGGKQAAVAAESAPAKAAGPAAAPAAAVLATGRAADNGQQTSAVEVPSLGGRIKASPLARKMAAASQIELGQVRGSGPGGRVIRRDIESFLKGEPQASRAAVAGGARHATAPPPAGARKIPHTRMRKTIAQRMLQSSQSVPAIHLSVDVRLDRVVAGREQINKQLAADGIKVSIGDFVTKAVALALRFHSRLNASFEPDAIVEHGDVNIGVAVALDDGLIVPVLHRADALGLREIRVQSDGLAKSARAGTLSGEQLAGGTFTISNLGMFGTRQFDAIINLPQVAILAVGAAEKRPVVEGDALVVGTVMTVTLTADHRAVDGAAGAQFLQTLKSLLEEPASMLI